MVLISGLLIGIFGSLHCVGMCGPLVLAVNYKQQSLIKNLLYQTGRLVSYSSLGLLFGFLGKGLSLIGLHQSLSIIAGVILILFTLFPRVKIGQFNLKWQQFVVVPLKKKLLGAVNKGSLATFFSLGVLNGLLPCGLVYVAVAASLAMSSVGNAMILMIGFGLGTWPLMLAMAMGGSWVASKLKLNLRLAIPVMTIVIGLLLIFRGLSLNIPYLSPVLAKFGSDTEITTCENP
jgi:uncharacterized protein